MARRGTTSSSDGGTGGGAPAGGNPEPVDRLIDAFSRMPGIGRRSAERLAFHLLKASRDEASAFARAVMDVKDKVRSCSVCCHLTDVDPCRICGDPRRDASTVLVVEQPRDVLSLESTGMWRGVYHVLTGQIDPLAGVGPEHLTIDGLLARVRDPAANARGEKVEEVILGLSPNMEGDSTALHVVEMVTREGVRTSRLARGLPAGSQLEYASAAVLADAIEGRRPIG